MLCSFIFIPAICFLIVTIFRKLIAGIFLAIVRVIGGVHFISDVYAGAFLGIIAGWISNYIFLLY